MQKEKQGFFRDVLTSVKDFDKYEKFATRSTSSVIKYFLLITLLFSLVVYGLYLYKFSISDEEGINFFKENILDINYDQEEFQIDGLNDIIVETKNDVIIPVWIYVLYLSSGLIDAVMLGVLGFIIARVARMAIPYKATFKMAIHALTLPIILRLIYIVVNSLTGFEIRYFSLMYTAISSIYIIVAILMIKTDIIGMQMELMRLHEEQTKIKEEIQNDKDKENEDKEEDGKKEKPEEKKKKEDNNLEGEPET